MKKKNFVRLVILGALFLANTGLLAQGAGTYREGVHYQLIENAPMATGDIVEVAEAFSYMCTHCATFEPYISAWQARQASNVIFRRIPVVFGRSSWEVYARAYVTADLMGVSDEAHGALMDKLWKKREVLRTMEELSEFYADFGLDPDTFLATSKSFAVDAKVRKDQRDVQAANVRGTPSLIVAGKYLVSNNQVVGSYDVLLGIVDFLVAKELAANAAANTEEPVAVGESTQSDLAADEQS